MPSKPLKPRAPSTAASPAPDRRQRVQAAETGMAVLKGLARLGGRATLTALAAHVQESPAKVHRYLASLIEQELVQQDAGTQQYYLGLQTLLLGVAAMRQADPIRLAEPALARLRESLEVTCFLAVMGNKGPTIVRFEEPGLPVTLNVRVGSVMPLLWSATGRVFLAQLDEPAVLARARAELDAAQPDQRALLDSADPIGTLRRAVRAAGCATVRDTNLKGISAVAAPVADYTGRTCAVLTALGATGGFDASADGPIAAAVRREARAISTLLGHQDDVPASDGA
ncbi:IclR family transcriptional regulator [Bordetella genomosp. 7]|uniref:IclR family transcriptional regulator n=1 Tax=Bordetella genomosp. 7 TaxID=1416805 RepID=UPI000B9EC939|nr:IclR family transcriptional regulator [Bordetella genomosp. 7]OZI25359.1 IclR family transcriptional regulator [Bordetella genomosp. 7]